MIERQNERVTSVIAHVTVVIPCASRRALRERIRTEGSAAAPELLSALDAMGTSRPVRLTEPQERELLRIIRDWAEDAPRGDLDLPDGIADLHYALVTDEPAS